MRPYERSPIDNLDMNDFLYSSWRSYGSDRGSLCLPERREDAPLAGDKPCDEHGREILIENDEQQRARAKTKAENFVKRRGGQKWAGGITRGAGKNPPLYRFRQSRSLMI